MPDHPTPWRPGLPEPGTICDVRWEQREYPTVLIVEHPEMGRYVRLPRAWGASGIRAWDEGGHLWPNFYGIEWRPIPAPQGV